MSGFAGIVTFSATRPDERAAARMANALRMFGAERTGVWNDERIHVVHSLRKLLPEDGYERQPLIGGDGKIVFVAIGRIDNRDDLTAELGLKREEARQLSDAGFMLRAFERWGPGSAERLLGDFAFAAWDSQVEALHLARDYRGYRPLFLAHIGGGIAFATSPKALFAHPDVSSEIDEERFAWFAARLWSGYDAETIYRDVDRVPPAHVVTVTREGVRSRQYFRFNPERRIHFAKDDEYVEAARALLDDAVRARFRSSGGVASHLSAGLDSTLVTEAAARMLAERGKRLTSYTAVPKTNFTGAVPRSRMGDEFAGASALAKQMGNIDHIVIGDRGLDIFREMPRITEYVSGGIGNPSHAWGFEIMADAARRGARVLLPGSMGNFTASYLGNSRLTSLLRSGRLGAWFSEVSAFRRVHNTSWRGTIYMSMAGFIPPSMWLSIQRLRYGWAPSHQARFAMRTDVMARARIDDRARSLGMDLSFRPPTDSWAERVGLIMSKDLGEAHMMAIGGFGVDVRDPMGDRRFVEYCLALPEEQYMSNGVTRRLARRMAQGRIPAEIHACHSRGLQSADWLDRLLEKREEVIQWIERFEASPEVRKFLDVPELRRIAESLNEDLDGSAAATIGAYKIKLLSGIAHGAFILSLAPSNYDPASQANAA